MLAVVGLEELFKLVFVFGVHGFDNKSVVVGKEEKAATSSSTFTGLENCRSVTLNVQGVDDALHGDVVSMQKALELFLVSTFDCCVFQPPDVSILALPFDDLVQSLLVVFLDVVIKYERVGLIVNFYLYGFLVPL